MGIIDNQQSIAMNKRLFLLAFFMFGLLVWGLELKAQVEVKRSSEITKIGSKEYYMHHVKPGETIQAISKVYQVSVEEIENLNPEVKEGLRTGSVIGIPVRELQDQDETEKEKPTEPVVSPKIQQEKPKEYEIEYLESMRMEDDRSEIKVSDNITKIGNKEYYLHYVKSGQTLTDISKAYHVTIEEIERLNPEVKGGIKPGLVIGIPVQEAQIRIPVNEIVDHSLEKPEITVVPEPIEEPVAVQQEELEIEPEPEEIPVVEPIEEPMEEPVVVQLEEPEVESEPEEIPVVEPVEEPMEEPVVVQLEEPEVEPEPEEIPVVEPVEEPMEEPVVVQLEEPEVEPEPEEIPVVEPVEEPMEEPVVAQLEEPEVEPEPEEIPVVEPIEEPVAEQQEEPEIEPEPEEPTLAEQVDEPIIEEEPVVNVPVYGGPKEKSVMVLEGGRYTVQAGEDLYDIAKRFGIDIADLKAVNKGLTNYPSVGTVIVIPNISNDNDYIVHKVEKNERTASLVRRWKVNESEFKAMNTAVGSHVFVNQVVLIPIDPVELKFSSEPVFEDEDEPIAPKEIVEDDTEVPIDLDVPYVMPDCKALPENASKRYNVALMIPLYLYDLGSLDVSKENIAKLQKARPLSFLQFYQGFMMAVEKLEKEGLKLNLTVIDVTDNVSSAHQALTQIEGKELDMIVGPFFAKSFEVIEEYAKDKGIIVVNPLSVRSSVVVDNPNVVKVKPGDTGLILTLTNLVKNYYHDSNVFIVSREKDQDTLFLRKLQHHLNLAINQEVKVSNDEFLQYAQNESERMELGDKMVPTINVEGQEYSTNDLKNSTKDGVVIHNSVKRYKSTSAVIPHLSGVRNNLIIAYGDDNVFATQSLNGLKKVADRYPITVVGATDWAKFEKLLVQSLLQMNAIYVSDFFVDYESEEIKRFVLRFRSKYAWEPQKYAFEGYDVAMYFMKALMCYGDATTQCLQCCDFPLLHTHYRFFDGGLNSGGNDGLENYYWSVYQYDKNEIELKAIEPFKKSSK